MKGISITTPYLLYATLLLFTLKARSTNASNGGGVVSRPKIQGASEPKTIIAVANYGIDRALQGNDTTESNDTTPSPESTQGTTEESNTEEAPEVLDPTNPTDPAENVTVTNTEEAPEVLDPTDPTDPAENVTVTTVTTTVTTTTTSASDTTDAEPVNTTEIIQTTVSETTEATSSPSLPPVIDVPGDIGFQDEITGANDDDGDEGVYGVNGVNGDGNDVEGEGYGDEKKRGLLHSRLLFLMVGVLVGFGIMREVRKRRRRKVLERIRSRGGPRGHLDELYMDSDML